MIDDFLGLELPHPRTRMPLLGKEPPVVAFAVEKRAAKVQGEDTFLVVELALKPAH